MATITITPMREEDVSPVARLHVTELGYSFNSKLGTGHMESLYHCLRRMKGAYVGVAHLEDIPVGVISGALDVAEVERQVIRSLGCQGCLLMALRMFFTPSSLWALWREMGPRHLPELSSRQVSACLSAVAVDAGHRRQGVAQQMIASLEAFFISRQCGGYWLETDSENVGAQVFYRRMGFSIVEETSRKVVFLKSLERETR